MKVAKVSNGAVADPASSAWSSIASEPVSLGPVGLEKQPTAYIREAWSGKAYGTTASASVAAATDGQKLYVRLEWADDPRPNGEFQDAAGAIFPGDGSAEAFGSHGAPVGLWYWENGRKEALSLTSRGPGVVRRSETDGIGAAAANAGGKWSVVLSGPVAASSSGKLGVAIWNGSNDERAGLGAASQWLTLEL